MIRSRNLSSRVATWLVRLAHGDAGAGIILLVAAAAALLVANSSLEHAYHTLLHGPVAASPLRALPTFHHWINDGLMVIFFFLVGLEIKREILDGELSNAARRRLPVIAAASGMAVPALVYLAVAGTAFPLAHGWAIPAATDIAFAVGILALAGKGLPASLRLFLLTVAIVDDLGAVAIIALFYTSDISAVWLGASAAVLTVMVGMNVMGLTRRRYYVIAGTVLWLCVLHSGVHATIAGVLAAFCVPLRIDAQGDSPLLRLEHALAPWSAYVIVPLFGFANAGVHFGNLGIAALLAPLPLAVALGLFVGKQAGIFGAIILSEKLGLAKRPEGATLRQLWGVAALCGIGFTMSLFIGALAFPRAADLVEEAKGGVLVGSLLSGLLGYFLLRGSRKPA